MDRNIQTVHFILTNKVLVLFYLNSTYFIHSCPKAVNELRTWKKTTETLFLHGNTWIVVNYKLQQKRKKKENNVNPSTGFDFSWYLNSSF